MIDPPPRRPTLDEAMEWTIRALSAEDVRVLLCGRSAVGLQGVYTGTVDFDIAVGVDADASLAVLDAYESRGDLVAVGGWEGTARYLVSGWVPVDVLRLDGVHPDLYSTLEHSASTQVPLGSAGMVRAVTREGYFVMAVMVGLRGFARNKRDPMPKVREAWRLFGDSTDRERVERLNGRSRRIKAGNADGRVSGTGRVLPPRRESPQDLRSSRFR